MKTKLFTLLIVGTALLTACKREKSAKPEPPVTNSGGAKIPLSGSSVSAYGTFYISNVSSSKIIEINGVGMLNDGNAAQQYQYFGSGTATNPNQKWYIVQQGTGAITSSTKFKLMNVASGKYLEVPLASTTPGVGLWQDKANTNNAQQWYIQSVGTNVYKIINVGNVLAVTNEGASTSNGTAITQEPFVSGNTSQQWVLNSIAAESYRDDDVVNFFHRANGTVAFDEGKSIALTYGANSGKVLWITEDAYAADQLQSNGQLYCQFFKYHNSALLQPASHSWDQSLTPNITTTNSPISNLEIIESPGDHNSTYRWPGIGIEAGSKVLLYTYESANGSTPANQAVYSINQNTAGLNWGAATRLTPNGMSGQTDVGFSNGMVKNPAGDSVYVYGSKSVYFNLSNVFLARFAANNPTNWTFWTGTGWSASLQSASTAAITVGSGNTTQQNVIISKVNGKYVMMQMDLGYFCDPGNHNIYISTATSPKGPFTAPQLVFTINDMYNGHLAKYYTPAIHPEFNNGHNELLVTYCLNYNADGGSCSTQTCFNNNQDPNYYQVKGVRIPYSLVGL
ncbi:RICIN domain-containing protein [Mucilaginibacter ginsenosidivorax]|uniref:Ricin B lectin domain-containing protein n=1 Tax=Mucilaginibacter ginsenosidivorax TaxID=862126 RepID=A0A5B8VVE5_9SPHI|nr:RICIN domain-containing protein [Mucilaginibacter ginsenosidivorax]QEC75111.1 hypothetical protein FSB76_03795 [Mucilaginibacter ginsenosidivorax]